MSQCHPCAINYDYIIKLETIYEDIQGRFFNSHLLEIGNGPKFTIRSLGLKILSQNESIF